MSNEQIAEKIYKSYFDVTGIDNKEEAKKHANALIDVQVQMMYQDKGNVIIEEKRDLYLEDWEEIKYLINSK